MGPIRSLMSMPVFQGRVAVPPIIAKVSMAIAGAADVKREFCTNFDDFLKVKEARLLKTDIKDSAQVLLALYLA